MASSGADESNKLKLYSYWGSSCSARVGIGLKLKGLEYEYEAMNLLKAEQQEFLKLNPMRTVPVLVDGDIVVSDSFAILLYLEERYPQHPLLPQDLQKRALNFQAANIVCSSIQPLQNLPVLKFIEEKLGPNEKIPWVKNIIHKGFAALEKLLKDYAGKYATGDEVFLADLFLAPQIHAAINRFDVDMNEFPILSKAYEAYLEIPAFLDGLPGNQPDAPKNT